MPLKRELTESDCNQWEENKKIDSENPKNPLTGFNVNNKKITYNLIENKCKELMSKIAKNKQLKSKIKSPEKSKSKSPEKSKSKSKSESESQLPIKHKSKSVKKKELLRSPFNNTYYPDLNDAYFRKRINELYNLYKVVSNTTIKDEKDLEQHSSQLCSKFEKTLYQFFVSNYISRYTPYNGILLYHGVGVGKTCSAITLAEGFLEVHKKYEEPKIWVVMPAALKSAFVDQIFSFINFDENSFSNLSNQCTGDLYIKMSQLLIENGKEKAQSKIKKLINSRYKFFTYEIFADYIEKEYKEKNLIVEDKVIIVDEAHNIRSSSSLDEEKRIHKCLMYIAETGIDNKMVMLSATPMYNEPEDIFDILQILVLNDKRTDILVDKNTLKFYDADTNEVNSNAINLIKTLASNYISYIKGKNPFTFAIKLSAKDYLSEDIKFLSKEPTKDVSNKVIKGDNRWLSKIDDGIVVSKLSESQLKYLSNSKNNANPFNTLPQMNIVYDNQTGEKGFYTFFTGIEGNDSGSLIVNYNKKYENALFPDDNHLGKYSGKFLNMCNIIKESRGIVVIYSNYIWNGILPIAISLEHMGFNREGASNILKNPKIIQNAPRYDYKTSPRYCILSSDNNDIMGSSSIDNLIKIINSDDNKNGEKVKVILMTPVASEGLSFFNVREMHITEAWYHFNKLSQVIGRGIRNCRHQSLPLKDRNVTVFMHASYNNNNIETADIHAYRIAAKKYMQSNYIENLIRDNAIDCSLMKNINYFPESIFALGKIQINTSQRKTIEYQLGDSDDVKPNCVDVTTDSDIQSFRKDKYKHFINVIKGQMYNILLEHINNNIPFISIDDIVTRINFDKNITYQVINDILYPNNFIDNYTLVSHNNGIHIIKNEPKEYQKIKILNINKIKKEKKEEYKLHSIANEDKGIARSIIDLYLFFIPTNFQEIVKNIIEENYDDSYQFISNCLHMSGALIHKNEIKNIKYASNNKYIGYIDIFNKDLKGYIYNKENSSYRDLTENEIETLKKVRKEQPNVPNMSREKQPWGIIIPIKKKNNSVVNTFKILSVGDGVTGMDCLSFSLTQHEKILNDLNNKEFKKNKNENCKNISLQLMKLNRLTTFPLYKPNE